MVMVVLNVGNGVGDGGGDGFMGVVVVMVVIMGVSGDDRLVLAMVVVV
jgi:hypothetical protein